MVLLGFLVVCACWSTTWYAIRLCLRDGYPPLYGAALRFLVSALVIVAATALWERLRRGRGAAGRGADGAGAEALAADAADAADAALSALPQGPLLTPIGAHRALFLAGVANGVAYALLYLAEQIITGGTAAVISATSPFFTAIAARLCGLERFLPRRLLGVVLGFVGVVVMMADGFDRSRGHLWAMVLVAVASAVLWPAYGVLLKRCAAAVPPLRSSTALLCWTGLTLLVMAPLRGEPFPTPLAYPLNAHLGLAYLALIGTIVAWTVYMWLLQRMDLTVLATMGLIEPVLALAVDLAAGDSALGLRGYLGAVLVLLGVALAALGQDLPHLWRALRRGLGASRRAGPALRAARAPCPEGRGRGAVSSTGVSLGGEAEARMGGALEVRGA